MPLRNIEYYIDRIYSDAEDLNNRIKRQGVMEEMDKGDLDDVVDKLRSLKHDISRAKQDVDNMQNEIDSLTDELNSLRK